MSVPQLWHGRATLGTMFRAALTASAIASSSARATSPEASKQIGPLSVPGLIPNSWRPQVAFVGVPSGLHSTMDLPRPRQTAPRRWLMADEDEGAGDGLSTPQKVVTGAALGVAIPAAVGIAKKLLKGQGGSDEAADDDSEGPEASGEEDSISRASTTARGTLGSESKAAGSGRGLETSGNSEAKSAGSKAKSAGSKTKSGASKAQSSRSKTRTSGSKAKTSADRAKSSAAGSRSGRDQTLEQLYRQARRLKIEGRSTMNKEQLARAVERTRGRT